MYDNFNKYYAEKVTEAQESGEDYSNQNGRESVGDESTEKDYGEYFQKLEHDTYESMDDIQKIDTENLPDVDTTTLNDSLVSFISYCGVDEFQVVFKGLSEIGDLSMFTCDMPPETISYTVDKAYIHGWYFYDGSGDKYECYVNDTTFYYRKADN